MSAEFFIKEDRQSSRERLIYNVTEDVLVAMEDLGVSKKELASRISKSKSYITQMLSGSRNMTIGTLSDICYSLDVDLNVEIKLPASSDVEEEIVVDEREIFETKCWEFIDFNEPSRRSEEGYGKHLRVIDGGIPDNVQYNWEAA